MKKNTAISEKLKRYSLLAASTLGSAVTADAQIIYTDVDPDLYHNAPISFSLDLNNDGIMDISFSGYSSDGPSFRTSSVRVSPEEGNSIANSHSLPKACEYGEVIDSAMSWKNNASQLLGFRSHESVGSDSYSGYGGNWLNQSDKYLALRLTFKGQQYYGWMRMSVGYWGDYTIIKEYAYTTLPNTPVGAGCINGVMAYADADSDGYGDPSHSNFIEDCVPLKGYVLDSTDCNDSNPDVHPGVCDGTNSIDDNCDGAIDNGYGTTTFYADVDSDGYGNAEMHVNECSLPAGYVNNNTDCNDTIASIHPGVPEVINSIDDNCNGLIDDVGNEPCDTNVLTLDVNGPYNTASATAASGEVAPPSGNGTDHGVWSDRTLSNTIWFTFIAPASGNVTIQSPDFDTQLALWSVADCNDYSTFTLIDANDDDPKYQEHGGTAGSSYVGPLSCSQLLIPGVTYYVQLDPRDTPGSTTLILTDGGIPLDAYYYADKDSDGYGDKDSLFTDCIQPDGYVPDSTDCNDSSKNIHPGAAETCNNIDDDCNGSIDDGLVFTTYYDDADGDGYGNPFVVDSSCNGAPSGYVPDGTDCDDTNPNIHPAPLIEWQKSLGGTSGDKAYSIQPTKDGGFIIGGYSLSKNGDVSGNHGSLDYWIVKMDSSGNIEWQESLGGSGSDDARSIQQTTDGGYIIAGSSYSNNGDVTGHHVLTQYSDYWIVKLNSHGNITWQKCLGGLQDDHATSVQQVGDGGFIVAGYSNSTNFDVSGNHGDYDYWIVKLDTIGNIEWQKSLGGSSIDEAASIQQTTDDGFIVAGYSYSNDGDVSGNHGSYDYWIIKLNASGNIEWQKSLAGSNNDLATSIRQTTDGGFIVAGYSGSNNGDVSANHGGDDYWIVKLNAVGIIEWQKSLGGSNTDLAYSIQQTTDGGFIIAGYSGSDNGDVSGNHGSDDYWIVKLNASGTIEWQESLGGSDFDEASSIQQTTDGGFIVAGYSGSNDGDVSGNHGSYDYWIVKLQSPVGGIEICNNLDDNCNGSVDEGLFVPYYFDSDGDGYGNPFVVDSACNGAPLGFVADSTDCNDTNPNIHPGADEIQNGIDDNCNGVIDEFGVGINDPSSSFAFSVFPNPNDGNVTIQATLQHEESLMIKVLDVAGKELYSENFGNVTGKFSKQLDISNFSDGTYLLQVIHDGESEIKKLVVE